MADDRTYIRVHDGLYEHPKVVGLPDSAFRLLIESWCYCSRNLTDGRITEAAWKRLGTPKARRELVAAGLAVALADGDGVEMHDYLEHQRSAEEVAAYKAMKRSAGAKGNHTKHHAEKGRVDPDCSFCQSPEGSQKGSHVRPQVRSQTASQTPRKTVASTETETTTDQRLSVEGVSHVSSAAPSKPPLYPDHCSEHANVEVPPKCGGCRKQREANAARATEQLPDYRLRVVPPLCGKCDDRWINTQTGLKHCPRCHPAEASSQQGECRLHPGHPSADCRKCDEAREAYIKGQSA